MLGGEGSVQKYVFGKRNSRTGAGLDSCLSDPCPLHFSKGLCSSPDLKIYFKDMIDVARTDPDLGSSSWSWFSSLSMSEIPL